MSVPPTLVFPADPEPDGDRLAPHHYYSGLLVVLWAALNGGAWGLTMVGALLGLFAFAAVWRADVDGYPPVGAAGALAGLAVAAAGLALATWTHQLWAALAVAGWAVAADDAVSHAVGWPTPLDALWRGWLYPALAGP